MSDHGHHWLTRLYPPAWRARYGDEMDELLSEQCDWRQVADVARAALIERLFHSTRTGADIMRTYPVSTRVLVRKPSAIVPIAMSVAALAVVLVAIAIFGAHRQADEGAAAHIWQVLMAGQIPLLAWFAGRWLRQDFRHAVPILGLQIAAFGAALLPVWLLGL